MPIAIDYCRDGNEMMEAVSTRKQPLALVVDDEAVVRMLAGRTLEQAGFSVRHAVDGVQAVSSFERFRPDLVLMDIVMPTMDGYAACSEIRGRKNGDKVPILMITGMNDVASIDHAYKVGATDFIPKPINWDLLRHRVRYLLRATHAVETVKEYELRYQDLYDRVPVGLFRASSSGKIVDVNDALLQMMGFENKESCLSLNVRDFCRSSDGFSHFLDLLQKDGIVKNFEAQLCRADRSILWASASARVVPGHNGDALYYDGSLQDITERKEAEQTGRELKEKDEQLRQAQKMEAVGRLAGGIAHDFNNFLTAINGYSDLLISRFNEADPSRMEVEEIRKAGARAASLARQLLAFSRKQVLQPKVLDLNSVIAGVGTMLRRIIGEHIELKFCLEEQLGSIKADPAQITQIIMNLAVNSRDAMPKGGRLTLETGNLDILAAYDRDQAHVHAGPYVVLAVCDTGSGMDEEAKAHLFEPFFTTKEVGKGTGLGLATVYGIVKQSGGYIWCYSEVDRGTCFKIYFPRVEGKPEAVSLQSALPQRALQGTETVLVVEDEEAVRQLVFNILEQQGYTVLLAPDGEKAVALSEHHEGPIHLVVTDIVMPGMTGPETATKIAERRPDVKILFMSGYSGGAIDYPGMRVEGEYLEKPFGVESLARKVREMLDR